MNQINERERERERAEMRCTQTRDWLLWNSSCFLKETFFWLNKLKANNPFLDSHLTKLGLCTMRFPVFLVLFVLVGTAFLLMAFRSGSSLHDAVFPASGTLVSQNRKLKENYSIPGPEKMPNDGDKLTLEDYHPIDPVPSSKASIHHKPIAHGSPLMPYIPKPTKPASPPRNNGPPGGPY